MDLIKWVAAEYGKIGDSEEEIGEKLFVLELITMILELLIFNLQALKESGDDNISIFYDTKDGCKNKPSTDNTTNA